MADIDRILAWYQSGVRFVCGCEADSLHAAVIRALRTGRLPVEALYRCPLHGAQLIGRPHRTGARAAEPGSSLRSQTVVPLRARVWDRHDDRKAEHEA